MKASIRTIGDYFSEADLQVYCPFGNYFEDYPFLIKFDGDGGTSPWFWGRVQGVGLIGWVNTRPMVCDSPSAHSVDARGARFIGEFF